MREVVSVPPPGSKPTMLVTGLLGVVLALEALAHPRLAQFDVVLPLRHLADGPLRRAQRERRVGGDVLAIFSRERLQLGHRDDPVHQAHVQRLRGAELPRGEHDLTRERRAHGVDQALHRRGAVAEAHLSRRNAEARVLGGDAQVAAVGDVDSRAEAVAADHRHHRLLEAAELRQRRLGDVLVALHLFLARALLLELRDVGAGDEGLVACPGQHHDPDRCVLFKILQNRGNRLPHVERNRVAALGVVEDQPAERAVLLREQPLGH
jgi:hypothetical protein